MAVRYYSKGEHPAGFIGFRVATTEGSEKKYRQKYFSLNRYGYDKGKKLAYEYNSNLRRLAGSHTKEKSLAKKKSSHIIAEGFRAVIYVEKKFRANEHRKYYSACFIVEHVGQRTGSKRFNIRSLGYDYAYMEACSYYSKIHSLNGSSQLTLMGRKPKETLFTEELLNTLQKKGHDVSEESIYVGNAVYKRPSKTKKLSKTTKQPFKPFKLITGCSLSFSRTGNKKRGEAGIYTLRVCVSTRIGSKGGNSSFSIHIGNENNFTQEKINDAIDRATAFKLYTELAQEERPPLNFINLKSLNVDFVEKYRSLNAYPNLGLIEAYIAKIKKSK